MSDSHDIAAVIKRFILDEFLEGEDPNDLEETTSLMTTGILDSIAILKLVSFLEKEFGVSLAAHELDAEHLNTIAQITALVRSKGNKPA